MLSVCQLICINLEDMKGGEQAGAQPSLYIILCVCKGQWFNERTAEVRGARGLHLSDRPHNSKPAVSMLILAQAP